MGSVWWRIKGAPWTDALFLGPNFLRFHAVFETFDQNIKFGVGSEHLMYSGSAAAVA